MGLIEREIEIRRPAERVWARLTAFERMPTWFYGLKRVSVGPGGMKVGAERVVTLWTGHAYREVIRHWDRPNAFSYAVLDPPALIRDWTALIALTPIPGGIVLRWQIRYTTRWGLLGQVADRCVLGPMLGIVLTRSLARLKRTVEEMREENAPATP